MESAVNAVLDPFEPSRDKTPEGESDAAADDPPDAGTDTEAAGGRGGSGIDVHLAQANAAAQKAQDKEDRHRQNDATKDSGPGYAAVGMGTAAHHGGCRLAHKIGRLNIDLLLIKFSELA